MICMIKYYDKHDSYTYYSDYWFEGVCLNSRILAPGTSEVGSGAEALALLGVDLCGYGDQFREATFYAQAFQALQVLTDKDVHFSFEITKNSPWEPKVPQRDPPASQGSQREAKLSPRTSK